jgi:undecaprenyl-diphosphatase
MFLALVVASLPVVIFGYIIHVTEPDFLRAVPVMAACSIVFGFVLWFADKKPETKTFDRVTMKDALVTGLAQALALVPGVSRSGITMTAARFLGFSRTESARFSLLLAVAAISGAGALEGAALFKSGDVALGLDAALAALLSFFSSLAALVLMMRWLSRATFAPFVAYRILFGIVLLAFYFSGYM